MAEPHAAPAGAASRSAALAATALLLARYVATMAPGVTFWDAGEFITAAYTLGIPHPPGTPLWVLVANVWTRFVPLPVALAANLLSAACTAVALGLAARLVQRWTGSRAAALAAALCAGAMSSVWLNATETEVYAASLLLSMLTLTAADAAGRHDDRRGVALVAYLMMLAVPLHLSALVAAPAAVLLAAWAPDRRVRWSRGAVLSAAFFAAQALGTMRLAPVVLCAACLVAAAVLAVRERRTLGAIALDVASVTLAAAAAASALLFLYVRAAHDPWLNQGDPSSFFRFVGVLGRRQYDVAGLWPRRAPVWLQAANVIQYADWQTALSFGPDALPSVGRAVGTVAYAGLAIIGSRAHRATDARSWWAMLVLLLAGTVGAAVHLNLAAGASIGWGVLPDGAPHEARDRDYFFVLGFVAWGMWAGAGAVHLLRGWRRTRAFGAAGVLVAAAPAVLNWGAVTRRAVPDREVPHAVAVAMLEGAPANAVLFAGGDNDSYPLWFAQTVEHRRPDVRVVTVSLLPADWYRAELARRDSLATSRWRSETTSVAEVARAAERRGRPLAASAGLAAATLAAVGGSWERRGVVIVRPGSPHTAAGDAARQAAARLAAAPARTASDPATRAWLRLARCEAADTARTVLLDSPCRGR